MFEFVWPWIFLLLPLPWVVKRYLSSRYTADPCALKVPFLHTLTENTPKTAIQKTPWILHSLWLLLLLAAARPQWVGDPIPLPQLGRDIMLAIDLSGSMQTPDMNLYGMPTTRLDVIKKVAREFVQRRTGDRLGLILFGSRAYLQTPLTFDRQTVATMLDDATIGLAGPRTAIGDAMGLAVKHLKDRPKNSRVLILLTDGANNSGMLSPLKATELAKTMHVRIHTIGIGSNTPTVPDFFGNAVPNPSSDLDEETLQHIANTTGGAFFRATDTDALNRAYQTLNELEPVQSDTAIFRKTTPLYPWLLGLALFISVGYVIKRIWCQA